MKLQNKIITALLLATTSTASFAECKWKTVIDTEKWYRGGQMAEARKIYLQQVIDGRFLVFNQYDIVIDTKGFEMRDLYKDQSLYETVRFLGTTGREIELQRLDGFTVTKQVYVPILNVYDQVYKDCSTKYLMDNKILLAK